MPFGPRPAIWLRRSGALSRLRRLPLEYEGEEHWGDQSCLHQSKLFTASVCRIRTVGCRPYIVMTTRSTRAIEDTSSVCCALGGFSMRLRVHRGTRQIGGTCVELESTGLRILRDLGLPLDASDTDAVSLPDVPGLATPDPSLLAILLSHGHRDHWGLLPKVKTVVPLIMGKSTESIMRAAADFVPDAFAPKAVVHLEDKKPLQLGPFTVPPWLVDHSAFDAYALEITAEGHRLFYSGDLRAHGRKGKLFERLVGHPPRNVDMMLMEGSSLGRLPDDGVFQTEEGLEREFIAHFKATPGMALVACSAQNIDRVVTVFRAAKQTGRTLIIDAYAAEVLSAPEYGAFQRRKMGGATLRSISRRLSAYH